MRESQVLKICHVVCLLYDRDLKGNFEYGIEYESDWNSKKF